MGLILLIALNTGVNYLQPVTILMRQYRIELFGMLVHYFQQRIFALLLCMANGKERKQ
jgi:hypothetical protein